MINSMTWQQQLRTLETAQQWDPAIELMQNVIADNPNDMDAYLSMNYLLMNLITEEDYDDSKFDNYAALFKKYFNESYPKFSNNPEYLYFMGRIVCIAEWFIGYDIIDFNAMLNNALRMEPDNLLYQQTYYNTLDQNDQKVKNYYQRILVKDSPTVKHLLTKGSLGEYVLMIMIGCAHELIHGQMITEAAYEQWIKELDVSWQ